MVVGSDGYGKVGYGCHAILWGIPLAVVHQTPKGMKESPYTGMLFGIEIRYMHQ